MSVRLACVLACAVAAAAGCVGGDPAPSLQLAIDADDVVMVGTTATVRITVTERDVTGPTTVTLRFAEDPALPTLVARTEGCTASVLAVTCELGVLEDHAWILVDVTFDERPESKVQMTASAVAGTTEATAADEYVVVNGVQLAVSDTLDPAQTGRPVDYLIGIGASDLRWADAVLTFNIDETARAAATITTDEPGCTTVRNPGAWSTARCVLPVLDSSSDLTRRLTVVWEDVPLERNPFPVDVTVRPGGERTGVIGHATETTAIQPATLSMTVTAAPGAIALGDTVSYTVELFNDSAQDLPETSLELQVQELLLGPIPPVSVTPACTSSFALPYDIRCRLGPLAAGARTQFVLEVRYAGVFQAIIADVRLRLDDVVLAERRGIGTNVISGTVDLAVAASDAVDPVTVGQPVSLAAAVGNHGGSDAAGVTVTATLPAALRFVAASAGCAHAAGIVTCDVGALASGSERAIAIVTDAIAAGMVTTTFAVDTTSVDPYPANDTATVSTTITTPTADLGLVLVDGGDPVSSFFGPSYGITVTNLGPDLATGVTVVVQLPAGYSVSIFGQAGCAQVPGVVTCALGALASGASEMLSFTGYGTPNTLASCTATVTADQPDPVPGNNSDTETTQVTP